MLCTVWIVAAVCLLLPSRGQGQGLFLSLRGTRIDNDGFVNAGDIDANDVGLLCHTDATDCCTTALSPGGVAEGDWKFPNGTRVESNTINVQAGRTNYFYRNRGQSVVRLNRRSSPTERGHFSCELRGVTVFVNILNIGPVSGISPSTPVTVTAGGTVDLQCSVDITPHPLPAGTSTLEFEWFFGQTFNSPLTSTTTNSDSTYSSTLKLTSVSESDGGMYTCRLRGNHRTAVSTTVTVEPAMSTTTEAAVATTNEIATTTEAPPTTTEEVTTSTEAPPTTTEEVTTSTEAPPPITMEEVATSTEAPPTTTKEEVATSTEAPPTTTEEAPPTTTGEVATTTAPPTTTEAAVTTTEAPTTEVPITIDTAVTASGDNIAGMTYSLVCSVTVTGSNDQPTITWLDDGAEIPSSDMTRNVSAIAVIPSDGSSTTYTRTLTFTPLSASHAGMFTCTAMLGTVSASNTTTVTVNNPMFTATVSDGGATPTAGQSYSLTCTVSGADDLDTNYQWSRNGVDINGETSATLSFPVLSLSNAGSYICEVTVSSTLLVGGTLVVASSPLNISLPIAAPTAVLVTPPPTTIFTGSSPTLTCTVEFSVMVVDVQLTVNVSWVLPGGIVSSGEPVTALNSSTYTSRITLDAVTNTDAGTYTCKVAVSSQSLFIAGTQSAEGSADITIAPLPAPTNLMVTETTATSIRLNWTQSEGADAVDRYEISYSFTINGCPELGRTSRGPIDAGSVTTYTLVDSGSNPIEEDSVYDISVRAVNSVAMSEEAKTTATTPRAAPSGPPQNIRNTSTNSTSITIQWDEVDCRERNGIISFYQVMFSGVVQNVLGSRTFTAGELLPRNSYSFTVSAVNTTLATGTPGTVTVDTSIPEKVGFLLGGSLYGNNSIVTISDIEDGSESLHCLTNRGDCCRGSDTGGDGVGEWYFPGNGSTVGTSNGGGSIYRNRGPSVVRLNRRNDAMMPTGVFRCEIPDASGTDQNIYVGVYTVVGAPQISSLNFSLELQELICTTSVSPPTTVSWSKNGQPLTIDGTTYEQSQRVIDTSDSVYDNVLYSSDVANFVGTFECMVANSIGEVSRSVVVDNVAISTSPFVITRSAVAICTTILDGVANIAWLRDGAVVMDGGALTRLELVFNIVNDSLHGDVYTCRVNLTNEETYQQNITISVEFPGDPISISADALEEGTAGQNYTLNCTVSKIENLINSPVVFWSIEGTPVTNGSGISIATVYESLSTTSVLTFDPLRTSHANVYVCEGSLTSPAGDEPFTVSSVADQLNVKISTPSISIAVPPGPLYAGNATPTSLTCTISLDPAVDDPVSVDQITVQWMRGMTELSNTTSRVTISTLSGSQPTFTSVLTLDPLSTEDTSFTCLARAQPSGQNLFVTASDQGERMTVIPVLSPPDPVVTISSSGSSTAGQTLTLTCSAVVLDGLIPSAIVSFMWSTGDTGPNLTLSSLLTSQGGVYTCTARLTIPEAGVDVTGSNSTNVVVQIPQPTLTISAAPRDEGFFRGLSNFSLTCSADIGPHVNSDVTVRTAWLFNGSPILSSDDVMVENASSVVDQVSNSSIRFTSLGLDDAGNYTCQVVVSAVNSNFILEANNSTTRDIVVETFPVQVVQLSREVTSTAGHSLMLICRTTRDPLLSATLELEWIGPGGSLVEEGSGVSIVGLSSTEDELLNSTLVFSNLTTSQGGPYRCRVNLTIPQENVTDHAVMKTAEVTVQLPAPISPLALQFSRDGDLYEGTTFNFTCVITPNRASVDTPFNIVSSVSGPGIPDNPRISISEAMVMGSGYVSGVVFGVLRRDDSGNYTCSATATSDLPYVSASEPSTVTEMLTVVALPPPVVTTSATPSPTAGQTHQLDCYATVPEFTVAVPVLEWVPLGISAGITTPPQVNGATSANRSLNFDPLRTSHGGLYTCRATLNIPRAGIVDRNNSSSENVVVLIPSSAVSITNGPYPPYNGTVFNLTCEIDLDVTIVDTNVMIVWVWSTDGREVDRERTTSPSARQIIITFNPLATNSSGVYYLNLSILPTENSDYINPNNESSTSYTLMVEALPVPVVSTAITSRSGDLCSEAMTLTCTATTVVNVFTPPTITWLFGGSPVPSGGSDPVMNSSTGQLIFNDISSSNAGVYTCRAILTIPEAGITDHYNDTSRTISTDQPDSVVSFKCQGMSASVLSLSWEKPGQVGSGIVGYRVEVREVQHVRPGSQELESVPLEPVYNREVKEMRTQVNQGLVGAVPYDITVEALNIAGCGDQVQQFCFTEEGEPPMPRNVTVERVNNTAITVRWNKLTLVELKGFAMYVITYTTGAGSKKRQATSRIATALYNESSKTIGGLPSGAKVDVQVHTASEGGMSAPATSTVEAVPSGIDGATIGGAIVAVALVALLLVIIIIIVIILVRRRRSRKTFSPGHMYDVGGKAGTEERELHPVTNNQPSSAAIDKEKEAFEESAAIAPSPVPRSAITTEVLDRMKPVSLASFRDHVAMRHEDRDKGFETEYQSFGTEPVNVHDIAKQPINRPKNRFANIFPYDFSRVTLCEIPGEESSDYINACTIDGYKRSQCYIAAQGPMPNTISDFWRMVWEKRMPNIVMLTKCLEAGRRKCEQYWADNIGEDYMTPDKKLNITTTSVMPYADFVIRTFAVKSLTDATLDPLTVTHYHFTSWPDHGVPKFATSLISFIRRVQRGHTKDSGRQLLVHCSAGVGRTGTFITLDSMLDRMAAKEADVNVYEFVYNMRQRRVLMVQTLAQYVFIHDALNELITCGQTDIVASALRTKVNFLSKVIPAKGITGFQNQFQLLEQVSRVSVDEDITDAMESYNQSKNRYPDRVPYNMSRARLRPTGEDGSEYINASFIDGYKQRNAYIATQGPLQHTVNDIWRMLYEFKSRTMVMLCNMNEAGGEAAYPFFPSKEEEPVKYGKMLVTLQSKAAYTDFIVRKFSIQEDKQSSPKNDGFVVTQFHLTEWAPDGVTNTGTLIEMLDMITKNQMNTGNRPITVMCNDGVGRTGTFICIHAQLERLKTEGVVDFFQSIKSARIQRAGLVPDVDQYAFCHTVLADYIDKFDNYANFKDMI